MEIEEIAKIIKQNGGNTYLVGGAVRDAILKIHQFPVGMEQFNVKDTYLICLPIADSLDFSLYFCYHNIVNYENMRGERHDHHGCKIEPCVWV